MDVHRRRRAHHALGLITLRSLTDRPAAAAWLSPAQRAWLDTELQAESAALARRGRQRIADAIRDLRVWWLAALFGCALVGICGMLIWLPLIIKRMGPMSDVRIGLLSALPPLLGVVGTILVGHSGDRRLHLAAAYALGGCRLLASALVAKPVWAYAGLCLANLGINSGNSLFWSLNASFMTSIAVAASIAVLNTIARFGGLVDPWLIGLVRNCTDSFALAIVAGFLFPAASLAATLRVMPAPHDAAAPAA